MCDAFARTDLPERRGDLTAGAGPHAGFFPVLSDAMLKNGLLQQHLQGLVLPNIMGDGGLLSSPTSITG